MPHTQPATAQSKQKQTRNRKHPMSDSERQLSYVARKREALKEIKIFVEPELKKALMRMCEEEGVTQADILQRLIKHEAELKGKL